MLPASCLRKVRLPAGRAILWVSRPRRMPRFKNVRRALASIRADERNDCTFGKKKGGETFTTPKVLTTAHAKRNPSGARRAVLTI